MTASVLGQVVTSHKTSVAHRACEFLLTGVSAAVSGQFIGTCKFFVTAIPMATERFFTCVGSQMSFEVRTLEVCLLTSWETANIVAPAREVGVCGGPALV